jgi:hypothetical protein
MAGALACLARSDPTLESAQDLAQFGIFDDASGACQREPASLALELFRPVRQLRLDLERERLDPHCSDKPED